MRAVARTNKFDFRKLNSDLEHDPEKWKPVFPRDKREAFARRSCSNRKIRPESNSTQLNQTLVSKARVSFVRQTGP